MLRLEKAIPYDFLSPPAISLPTDTRLQTKIKNIRVAITETFAPYIHPHKKTAEFTEIYDTKRKGNPFIKSKIRSQQNFAERSANEYYASFEHASPFGEQFYHAMTAIWHHGFQHRKDLAAATKIINPHIPEFRPSREIRAAQFRFPGEHDINQVITDYRSEKGYLPKNIDGKWGHALGGAIVALATIKDYQKATKVTMLESQKTAKALAIQVLCHDQPQELITTLGFGTNPQYEATRVKEIGGIDGLREMLAANHLNIFSLSPKDLLELLHEEKEKRGFDSYYGISPTFEKQFANELASLAIDTTPLGADFSGKEKEDIRKATIIETLLDVRAMLIPQDESLLRMFTVPRSINQPLSWTYTSDTSEREILAQTLSGKGTTDTQRKILEAATLLPSLIEGTPLEANAFLQKMIEEDCGLTFVYLRQQLPLFMRGHEEEIREHITKVFDGKRHHVFQKITDEKEKVLWMGKLDAEENHIMMSLLQKPTQLYTYSDADIASFQRVAKAAELDFWIKRAGNIQEAQRKIQEYEKKYDEGQRPITPTNSPITISKPGNGRRLYSI